MVRPLGRIVDLPVNVLDRNGRGQFAIAGLRRMSRASGHAGVLEPLSRIKNQSSSVMMKTMPVNVAPIAKVSTTVATNAP